MRAADVAAREVAVEASPKRFSMMAIKTVVAGALGEGLEIYDFLVFSFFAVYISRAFFPQQGPTQSLLLTVANRRRHGGGPKRAGNGMRWDEAAVAKFKLD